jgi:hypothetical protein
MHVLVSSIVYSAYYVNTNVLRTDLHCVRASTQQGTHIY